jgi:hypothetical protein
MHRLNAPGCLIPTTAICARKKMADQAVQHIDNPLRKHHSTTLLTLPHLYPSFLKSPGALGVLGQFLPLK